jgi:hypothetical protein
MRNEADDLPFGSSQFRRCASDGGRPPEVSVQTRASNRPGAAVAQKKREMRWTPRGAHLLLQVRVQTLNDNLRTAFGRWYPDFGCRRHEKKAA